MHVMVAHSKFPPKQACHIELSLLVLGASSASLMYGLPLLWETADHTFARYCVQH